MAGRPCSNTHLISVFYAYRNMNRYFVEQEAMYVEHILFWQDEAACIYTITS